MKNVPMTIFLFLLFSVTYLAQEEPKGKIHGYMFGDYYYNIARDSDASSISNAAEKGEKDFNGFQFRRIYLGYDYTINKSFSTRLRLEANQKENTSGGKVGFFIKDAYLKWKNIFAGTDIILGMSPPPTFSISESYWGYRSLAKTIMDLRKISPSRDFGISIKGKISDGVKYWVMAANGEGNKPETNKEKRIYGHLALEPVKNLAITLHGDVAFHEDIEDEMSSSILSNNKLNTAIFVGYKESGKYSFGVEGFYQIYQNELVTGAGLDDQNSIGISVFGSADVTNKIALVGRYDYYDPVNDADFEGDVRNYFLAAINYKADPKVWIMPNIVMESYESLPNGVEFDSAITGRISFFYRFN